jgi:predicted metal-binding membrane protein
VPGRHHQLIRRDQLPLLLALLALTVIAWCYVVWLASGMAMPPDAAMPAMPGMDMAGTMLMAPAATSWTPVHLAFIFAMWAVMMIGMMTPSVTPMVLLHAQVMRHSATPGQRVASSCWFLAGYLGVWMLFAAVASLAQWQLDRLALMTPMMESASRPLGAAVLIATGVYQWLPIKDACLVQCRSPLSFIQRHGGFQSSVRGSLRLGFVHGMYCVGCCWALMALLFAVGVMNLLWIAALTITVLLEKLLPRGRLLARLAGCASAAYGLWMLRH